jgi:hypothetical protein
MDDDLLRLKTLIEQGSTSVDGVTVKREEIELGLPPPVPELLLEVVARAPELPVIE